MNLSEKANLRLMEAANAAGFNWGKVENFIDSKKCIEGCSDCMLGCPKVLNFQQETMG